MAKSIEIKWVESSTTKTLSVVADDSDYLQTEVMQASTIVLSFSLYYYTEIPIGAYIERDNEKFYLLDLCQPTKHNSESFDYSLTFYNVIGMFSNWVVQSYADNKIKFSLTAKPYDFLEMIVKSCNSHLASSETQFSIGDYDTEKTEQLLSFDATNVFDALNNIADVFNTEWYVSTDRKICLAKVGNTASNTITIQYGEGCGIKPDIQRKNSNQRRIDKIFVQGGDQNIIVSKYGSQYLLLPKNKTLFYDGETFSTTKSNTAMRMYVSDSEGQSIKGQDYNTNTIHCEKGFDGSSIYPSKTNKVTKVTWSPSSDMGEYDTYAEAKAKNPNEDDAVFCNIYDESNDVNFWASDIRAEGTETITFQSGKLAGRTFELQIYKHSNKEFKLVSQTDSGVTMPNETFTPSVNDEFIVFGMQLPDKYVSNASLLMMKEAIKEMYQYEMEQVLFTLPIDEIWNKQNDNTFKVGDYIIYKDDDFAKDGLKIRITQIREYLNNKYKIELTLSNCLRTQQSIKKEIKSISIFKNNIGNITNKYITNKLTTTIADADPNAKTKSWVVKPFTPYYKGDTWLVTEDTTIDGVTFKKGVTYLCKSTRLEGTFTATDWSPMSLYKYNDLDTLPSINDTTLKGNVYLATKEQIDTTNSNVLINKNDISAIREEIKNLLYSKTYDFTDKTIEEDTDLRLVGNATWVFEDGNEKIVTEREGDALVIAVPRESTYTVTIDIAKYEGALVVKAYDNNTSGADYTEYVYKDEPLVITYKSVSSVKVVFSTVTWLNSIVVTDIKMPSVPTKFSQLTNDLDLVNCTINETEGSIEFNIG